MRYVGFAKPICHTSVSHPTRRSQSECPGAPAIEVWAVGGHRTALSRPQSNAAAEAAVISWAFPCRRRRGSFRRIPTFPQTAGNRLLGVVQVHIGLCAPRMPRVRPRNADKSSEKRPFFTEENSVLHRYGHAPPECRRPTAQLPVGCCTRRLAPLECRGRVAHCIACAPRMPNRLSTALSLR